MKYGDIAKQVYMFLLKIPKGKVTTYGDISLALFGNTRCSRIVGNILHNNPDPDTYPCYKVVNGGGGLAKNFGVGGSKEQERRLRKDGIEVKENKVDLRKYRFLI